MMRRSLLDDRLNRFTARRYKRLYSSHSDNANETQKHTHTVEKREIYAQ